MLYYHNPKCSKSRAGLEILNQRKLDFQIKEYLKEPLNFEELKKLFQALDKHPQECVRSKEDLYNELRLDKKALSEDEWIEVIRAHPKLLERPILLYQDKAVIGRPPEKLIEIL